MAAPGIWGDEFLVNSVTAGAQISPVIAALADGRFAIAYTDFSQSTAFGFTDRSDSAVRVQVFSSDASTTTGPVQVNSVTTFFQQAPRIAPTADGGFVIAFADLSSGWDTFNDDIWAEAVRMQRFTADAEKVGIETRVNTTVYGDQDHPSIALLETGQIVVAWDDGYWDVDENVHAQVFNANGTFSGGEFRVNAGSAGSQTGSDIAALPNGGYVVTWTDASGADGDGARIVARMFNASGYPTSPDFQANTTQAGDQFEANVTALAGGGFVVVWTDNSRGVETGGDDTSSYALRAQIFGATGQKVGGEFLVNATTTWGQVQPEVLALDDGRFIVAWSDTSMGTETGGDDPEYGAIRARIFGPDGSPDGDEFLVNVTTTGHQNEPQMAELADGRVAFTWTDYSYGAETGGDDGSNGAIRARILDLRETAVIWTGTEGDEDFTGTCWDDRLTGDDGNDTLSGADGDDKLFGNKGDDRLTGNAGADLLKGNYGADVLDGGSGDDRMLGGKQDDLVRGGDGDDRLKGGNGDDRLVGGAGADVITGGNDADTFVFLAASDSGTGTAVRDTITDFEEGLDRIDLSAIDADTATPWDDAFVFVDHDAFSGTAGEIRYVHNSERSLIKIDLDGDTITDMVIELSGWHLLTAADFIL